MPGQQRIDRGTFLRHCLALLACFVASVLTIGCKDRKQEVPGTWDWDNLTVQFEGDGTWGAVERKRPTFEKFGGTWTISGDDVHLGFAGAALPSGNDAEFTLSDDGRRLVATTGASGTMTKK